jgi:hypothetical protein
MPSTTASGALIGILWDKFWKRVKVGEVRDCWPWTGHIDQYGYGEIQLGMRPFARKKFRAHRVAWEMREGQIPQGLVIDHLCRNRRCVNARHMRVVTLAENVLAGNGYSGRHARQTECIRGHALVEENIYRPPSAPNQRHCRSCITIRRFGRRIRAD